MTYRISFNPQVEVDVAEAASWYEAQRRGLGKGFVNSFDQSVAELLNNPFRFRKIYKETRRAPLDRFPYGLIYRVREDVITVVACMHARRHQSYWQSRE